MDANAQTVFDAANDKGYECVYITGYSYPELENHRKVHVVTSPAELKALLDDGLLMPDRIFISEGFTKMFQRVRESERHVFKPLIEKMDKQWRMCTVIHMKRTEGVPA